MTSTIIAGRAAWPEAEIIEDPIKVADAPRLLVRRTSGALCGPRGEELVACPGYPAISLFSGAGGMDLGIEMAGFVTLCQVERDRCACETLIANRPRCFRHSALIQGDIHQCSSERILCEAGLRVGECWLVCGGPPCQGFSTANSKSANGTHDDRNDLVFEFLRVVRDAKPRHFVFENVPGLVNFNKGAYLEAFLRTAWECFYEIVYGLVNAAQHGVPQDRVRLIAMGTRRDVSEIEGVIAGLPRPQCFAEADLSEIEQCERLILFPEARAEIESLRQSPGIRYFPDRPVLRPPRPTTNRNSSGRVSSGHRKFFDRLRREEPDRLVEV